MKYDPIQRATDIENMAAHLTAGEIVAGDAYFNAVCNYYDLTVAKALDLSERAQSRHRELQQEASRQTYAVVLSDGHMPTRVFGPYATEALARAKQRRTAGYSIVCPMGAT